MTIALQQVELRKVDIATRMPFRYGIATLAAVPYLLVVAEMEVDGRRSRGVAADILPPNWFTKQPDTPIEDEIAEMLTVIRATCGAALELGEQESVFCWWQSLYERQMSNPLLSEMPPLLKGFGVSLLERAAIDATCRKQEVPFHVAVRSNLLGISLGTLHLELEGRTPADFLPKRPSPAISIRHTVGLADPLETAEIAPADRLNDGLPQSLEACIQHYGLTHLKIKVPANIDDARSRLLGIATLLGRSQENIRFTLDGNEFFSNPAAFRVFWEELTRDAQLSEFIAQGLLVVEQPLHRDVALSESVRQMFSSWEDAPPIIIDESDGELTSLRQALDIGFAGTSHKNCKGVIKGLANACLLNYLNRRQGNPRYVCTGEDLMNLGPVALLQDLAVGAVIGLEHMERNGHHYVAGLQQMPAEVQQEICKCHDDLFQWHETEHDRYPILKIKQGKVNLESVNQSPFGYAIDLDVEQFELIDRFSR